MGERGKIRDYAVLLKFSCTESQDEFISDLARLQNVTKPEAIRRLIDRAFADALLKEAFPHA